MPKMKIGSIHRLPSGKYLARYSAPDGRRIGKTFLTKSDGTKWLQTVYSDISSGRWVSPNDASPALLFEDYARRWLDRRRVKGRPLAERTREGYEDLLDRLILPTFGRKPLHQITRNDVDRWFDSIAISSTTGRSQDTYRARAYSLLRTIMTTALDDEHIRTNPVHIRGAGSVERSHEIRPASLPELATITEAVPDRYRLMVELAAWCALRFGELTELRRGDIDVKRGVIVVRRGVVNVQRKQADGTKKGEFIEKGPKSAAGKRDVTIPPHVMPRVRSHLLEHTSPGADGLLFPAALDPTKHMRQSALARVYYPAREAAGRADLRFHDLRHTGLTYAAQMGATIAELMKRAGHSSSAVAMRYQHATPERDAEIAAKLSALASA